MSLKHSVGKTYTLVGDLSQDDVNFINSTPGCILEVPSVANLPLQNLAQIKNDRIISLYDCYNYKTKAKYRKQRDYRLTRYSSKELSVILNNIKKITSRVDPSWSDTKKAMFCALAIAREIEYEHKAMSDSNYMIDPNTQKNFAQTLRGILYGKGVCVCYSKLFKACGDLTGFNVEFQQNKKHAWNVFTDEHGNRIPVDITWISTGLMDPAVSTKDAMENFGRKLPVDFYADPLHDITGQEEDGSTNMSYTAPPLSDADFKQMFAEVNQAMMTNEFTLTNVTDVTGATFSFTPYPVIPTDGYGFKAYVVSFEGKVTVFYAQDGVDMNKVSLDTIKTCLKDRIGFYGDDKHFSFYKTKLNIPSQAYERSSDGNVFVYNTPHNHQGGLNYYKTLRVVGGKLVENVVCSRDDLTNTPEGKRKNFVANGQLSNYNIDKAMSSRFGYLGEYDTKRRYHVKIDSSVIKEVVSNNTIK